MRTIMLGAGAFAAGLALANVDADKLNQLLDERRTLNMEYAADNVAWAEEEGGEYKASLIQHERGVGNAWDDLIRYATEHDDAKLKTIVLRLEYHDELRGFYDWLGYAETDEERDEVKAEISDYEEKLKLVDPAFEPAKPAAAEGDKPARRGGPPPY